MKYPRMHEEVLVNRVQEEMRGQGISQRKLGLNTGLSRQTISRLCRNSSENFRINTLKKIADSLGVELESLFKYVLLPQPFRPVSNGFSLGNLAVLDDCFSDTGLRLRYQVYANQGKMNIETKNAGCRRLSFSGNWMFDDFRQSKLTLVDLDVDYSRSDVQEDEIEQLYAKIIMATISYARQLKINVIVHSIVQKELLTKEKWAQRRGPNVAVIREKMLRQLGFVEYSCADASVEQLRYRI